MDYREARVYLDEVAKYGSVLGLDNMKEMLRRLGDPQDELRFIHISGTNGKGSVLAYLSTILKEAGYLVGRYISPTLFAYRERIQVNEEYIEKESLARLTGRVAEAVESMVTEGLPHPTVFEIETALGFLYFRERQCDVVVLETGLGGLEDATNVVQTSILEVITSISMDHMGFLGSTLSEIAANKAGIIKPGTTVVSVKQKPEAMRVIEQTCRQKNCVLRTASADQATDIVYGYDGQRFSYRGDSGFEISLAGSCQIENAVLAVEAVKGLRGLGYEIGDAQLRSGLKNTRWKGRFSVIAKEPLFIIDGAHNREAAEVLEKSIEMYFTNRRIFYIMGVFRDKEYEEIVKKTVPLASHIMTIQTPGNDRALPAEELTRVVKKYNRSVETAENIEDAVQKSLRKANKEDVIIAFGSLSFLGEITRAVAMVRSTEL